MNGPGIPKVPGTPKTTRRPPGEERKAEVVGAAAALFLRHGYHRTSMGEIAAAVGITPPALYRHVSGKQELLGKALVGSLDETLAAMRGVRQAGGTAPDLLRGLLSLAVARRGVPDLWRRESKHLAVADARAVLARVGELRALVGEAVRPLRPDMDEPLVEFLAWCVLSVVVSVAEFAGKLPREALDTWALALATALVTTAYPDPGPPRPQPHVGFGHLASHDLGDRALRRELLVAAATRLWHERGYAGVGIEEVGAAVGLAGPSVYHHFASKAELLAEVFERNEQALLSATARAMVAEATAEGFLRRLLRSYTAFAVDNPDLVGVTSSELAHLDADRAARAVKAYREAAGRWTRALMSVTPTLGVAEAQLVVRAVVATVSDAARNPRLLRLPNLAALLDAAGAAMMLPPAGFPAAPP